MENTCFIIMPIGTQKCGNIEVSAQELKDKYTDLISEAIKRANPSLKIIRADEIPDPGGIVDQIIELLTKCRYVVADITCPNPNVYYELGRRHSFHLSTTILIKEKNGIKPPFDIEHLRHIKYENTPTGLKNLSYELKKVFDLSDKYPEKYVNKIIKLPNNLRENGQRSEDFTLEIEQVPYEYNREDWFELKYSTLNLLGKAFVAFKPSVPNKLAELILDSEKRYTLKIGEVLDLGYGYELEIKQVKLKGRKVWVEFTKDGEFVDDNILNLSNGPLTWIVKLSKIEEEDEIPVFRVHFTNVFSAGEENLVEIQGIWLIDYENAFTIEEKEEIGDLIVSEIGNNYLKLLNKDNKNQ